MSEWPRPKLHNLNNEETSKNSKLRDILQNKWPACLKNVKVLKDKKNRELFQLMKLKEWIWQVIATCDPGLVLGPGKKFLLKTLVKGKNITGKLVKLE